MPNNIQSETEKYFAHENRRRRGAGKFFLFGVIGICALFVYIFT